jgi:hypothetical protein
MSRYLEPIQYFTPLSSLIAALPALAAREYVELRIASATPRDLFCMTHPVPINLPSGLARRITHATENSTFRGVEQDQRAEAFTIPKRSRFPIRL